MKNFNTIFSILLLCLVVNISKGQTEASTPTAQEALDFMNKVLKESPGTELTNSGDGSTVFPIIMATLDGCHLTFKSDVSFPYNNTTWVASKRIVINLSSVYTTDNIILNSATDGDIIQFYHSQTVKPNGKVNWSSGSTPDQRSIASFGICDFLYRYNMEEPPQFIDQHYKDRFIKAVMFLVKQCGGGKIKVDSNDKFK